MSHEESNEQLSSEEKKFGFYKTRGEDFMRIEIYRNAKKYYKLALEMNIDNESMLQKIKQCDELIGKESKTFIAIVIVVLIIACFIIGVKIF
jgi:hypothetical protein